MNRAGGSSLTQNRGSAGAIGPLVGGEAEDVRGHQVADGGGDGSAVEENTRENRNGERKLRRTERNDAADRSIPTLRFEP